MLDLFSLSREEEEEEEDISLSFFHASNILNLELCVCVCLICSLSFVSFCCLLASFERSEILSVFRFVVVVVFVPMLALGGAFGAGEY